MASPTAATADSAPPVDRVYTRVDLEELLGGPHILRRLESKLAGRLRALPPGQRITVEFDRIGGRFAVHVTTREPL